jgi:TPP-dependent pyruvate/acetoin dehydrogenase alpha subunit
VAAEIEREAAAEIEAAVRFARDSPFPDPKIATTLVYAT